MTPRNAPSPTLVFLVVSLAVGAVSASAILIRLADAPGLAIAFYRNALAALVLLPFALLGKAPFPRGRALWLSVLSGVALGLHFGLWIESLAHTSVAASVVLVCTQPLFVALLARVFLGERTSSVALAGIVVAFAGTALIALNGGARAGALLGNALALGGAIAVAVYVLIGRAARAAGTGLLPYTVVVYAVAALSLYAACLVLDTPLAGFSNATWGWIGAVTLLPQLLGHTLLNWALRHVPASLLSGTILAEPVVSTALAWLVLAEVPSALTIAGGLVVLVGLALLIRGRERGADAIADAALD